MKRIRLTGKYAIGQHRYAIVDDDLFESLNRYKWKAKPNQNGTQVYAVRNIRVGNSCITLRLHREVVGIPFDGVHVIDHINRNSLDNRRDNLRLCTQSENIKNSDYDFSQHAGNLPPPVKIYLCIPHTCQVKFGTCKVCGDPFQNRSGKKVYCGSHCRYTYKNRRKAANRRAA